MKNLLEGAKKDFKSSKAENQSVSIKSSYNESQKKNKKEEKTSSKNFNVINMHLTNSILRNFKEDILDEVKFQEYIYKTISKRFEIIAKNNKVSKYLIINSVLAQFLKENNDEVEDEIKKFKKKLNDF